MLPAPCSMHHAPYTMLPAPCSLHRGPCTVGALLLPEEKGWWPSSHVAIEPPVVELPTCSHRARATTPGDADVLLALRYESAADCREGSAGLKAGSARPLAAAGPAVLDLSGMRAPDWAVRAPACAEAAHCASACALLTGHDCLSRGCRPTCSGLRAHCGALLAQHWAHHAAAAGALIHRGRRGGAARGHGALQGYPLRLQFRPARALHSFVRPSFLRWHVDHGLSSPVPSCPALACVLSARASPASNRHKTCNRTQLWRDKRRTPYVCENIWNSYLSPIFASDPTQFGHNLFVLRDVSRCLEVVAGARPTHQARSRSRAF